MLTRALVLLVLVLVPAPALAQFSLVPSGTFPTTPMGSVAEVADYDDVRVERQVLVAAERP